MTDRSSRFPERCQIATDQSVANYVTEMCIKAADRVLKGTRTHLVVAMETKRQREATKSGCAYTQPTLVERQRKRPGRYEKQRWRPPGSQVGNTFSTFITLSDFDFPAKPVPFDPPSTLESWKPAGKGGKTFGQGVEFRSDFQYVPLTIPENLNNDKPQWH
ncbi:unnamed protein product (mitochondrion) [Plasmodiophora brassicae]|uniref:Uncharacterized protein n=1 Tax=Plasmodiophora brassicae TaxID=37360 RepID=A0A0G4IYW6_PLABS|nr:hypothetical protein PBRA_001511 [Plasmodiophora brassicae]SPQ94040.1 unnamed protein product [Plasmodiophora brassicae]